MKDTGELMSKADLQARSYERPQVEQDEIADRDWMEMVWLLRYENPDLFIEMLTVLRAKARAHDLGADDEEEAGEDDGKVETSDTDRGRATPAARESDEESAI